MKKTVLRRNAIVRFGDTKSEEEMKEKGEQVAQRRLSALLRREGLEALGGLRNFRILGIAIAAVGIGAFSCASALAPHPSVPVGASLGMGFAIFCLVAVFMSR